MSRKGSRKILSDLQKLYPELYTVNQSANPIGDFEKIFSNSDSKFFVVSSSGDLTEI
jgi:hypothetical protein